MRDDIINMVQETIITCPNENPFDFHLNTLAQIERFAALVAAAEREACAKVCEEWGAWNNVAQDCAAAIRARGKQ